MTRAQAKTRARDKADMKSSQFIDASGTEENDLFTEAYTETWNLFANSGQHMADTDYAIVANGSTTYNLPSTFFACLKVYRVDGTDYIELKELQPDQEAVARSLTGNEAICYKIRTNATTGVRNIQLYPKPSSGSYIVQYCPTCPILTADGDAIVSLECSDQLLVVTLARKYLSKESTINEPLELEYKQLLVQVLEYQHKREMTSPGRVQDVRQTEESDWMPFDYFPPGRF